MRNLLKGPKWRNAHERLVCREGKYYLDSNRAALQEDLKAIFIKNETYSLRLFVSTSVLG
jgi:hypothetical protein